MSSGNFVIGEDLSMDGFNKCIRPAIYKNKAEITDIFSYSENGQNKILITLIGKFIPPSDLEETLKKSMEEVYPILEKDSRAMNSNEILIWPHQIKKYPKGLLVDTIGVYQDSETASKVFQNLAVKYSLADLEDKLEETSNCISDFGEKFKDFR